MLPQCLPARAPLKYTVRNPEYYRYPPPLPLHRMRLQVGQLTELDVPLDPGAVVGRIRPSLGHLAMLPGNTEDGIVRETFFRLGRRLGEMRSLVTLPRILSGTIGYRTRVVALYLAHAVPYRQVAKCAVGSFRPGKHWAFLGNSNHRSTA